MKKNIRVKAIIFLTIGIVGLIGYLEILNYTFVDRTIRKYTGISKYEIIKKVHDNHEWFVEMSISSSDGERLLGLHRFSYGYNVKYIAGRSQNDYIENCGSCWYYLDKKDEGIYGYVLYCLSDDKKLLKIYEEFGN